MGTVLFRNGCVLALFCLLTAVWFWGWLPGLGHHLIGPPEDNMQDFWNSWYGAMQMRLDTPWFTKLIRFPEGTPLDYHSFAYVQVAMVRLLNWLFNPKAELARLVALHNLTLLASFPLAGLGAFLVADHLTKDRLAGLASGFIFAFNPSHIEQVMHHAHVGSIEFLPFFALCYLRAAEGLRWQAAAILCNVLAALSCWYYLVYDGYFVLFHTGYLLIRDRKLEWRTPLTVLAGTTLVLSPLLVPMIRDAAHNPGVYAAGSDSCVADLLAYFLFPPFHLLSQWSLPYYHLLTGNLWEDTVYLGAGNLLLLALWLIHDRRLAGWVLSGMLVFCVFASGDHLHAAGHSLLAMPDSWLSQLPLVRNVRTPSRAIVYVYLFLSVGAGLAASRLWRWNKLAGAAMAALLLIDAWPAKLETTPLVCAPAWQVIRDDPDSGFAILDLPGFDPTSFASYVAGNFAMMQQACHGRPILQGNTSRDVVRTLRDRLEGADLAAEHVKYVVVTHPQGAPFLWEGKDVFAVKDPLVARYRSLYRVVYDGADRTILKVY